MKFRFGKHDGDGGARKPGNPKHPFMIPLQAKSPRKESHMSEFDEVLRDLKSKDLNKFADESTLFMALMVLRQQASKAGRQDLAAQARHLMTRIAVMDLDDDPKVKQDILAQAVKIAEELEYH